MSDEFHDWLVDNCPPFAGPDKRRCLVEQPDGSFAETDFRRLKKGDRFKFYECTGEPVNGKDEIHVAATDAHYKGPLSSIMSPDSVWTIATEYSVAKEGK